MAFDLSSYQMIEMAVFNTASLTGSFQVLNGSASYLIFTGSGFQFDIKILKIYNDGTTGVTFSLDGLTRHDYIPSKGTLIVDLQTNHSDNASNGAGTLNGRQGQLIWGTGTAGSGNLYISGFR